MKKILTVAALVVALVLPASPAGATYILPPHLQDGKGTSWQWGKCRHHDAPWGNGRRACQVVRYAKWGAR